MDLEITLMELICNAGEAKSHSMEAVQYARNGETPQAKSSLEKADIAIKKAHLIQTQLIGADEGEGKIPVTLIMVHAQDHLMTTMQFIENANEFINVYQRLDILESRLLNA